MRFFKLRLFITKWTHYEYWPLLVLQIPLIPFYIFKGIQSRYIFYVTAANPGIEYGGFYGESKISILDCLNEEFKPKTLVHRKESDIAETIQLIQSRGFELPLIVKPNIGERGDKVVKSSSFSQIETILKEDPVDYIIQEFIDYPHEFGVLYGRDPEEEYGTVRSIVTKNFLSVTGDGKSSTEELLYKNKRAWFQMERLKAEKSELMKTVLPAGENVIVEPIGNHCKGTEFIDANDLISPELNRVFDGIAKQFEGFYYGRFDLKARSIEEFQKGQTIRIFELNGVSSEAGHIYDKNYNLYKVYRDVFREMRFVYKVSVANIKRGIKPNSALFIFKLLFKHFRNKKRS